MQNFNQRSEEILETLVSTFINDGKAVGSATIAKTLDNRFSSATIRNVMADLEKVGLLTHKHTSGGRIPTEKGIRYYVDQLIQIKPLSDNEVLRIKSEYEDASYSIHNVFHKTSKLLSTLSHCAGVVVAPTLGEIVIKHMEFIPLSKSRVLGIFVGRNGLVENRIISTDHKFTYSELERITNYCNRAFYGLNLREAKFKLENEVIIAQKEYDLLINRAHQLSEKMFQDVDKSEMFVDGKAKLLEESDLEKASAILEMLEEKKELMTILGESLGSEKVKIFIGSESGFDSMSDCSLITAAYKKNDQVLGTLGVIGPTRMNYSKVIPIVESTANLIGNILSGEDLYDE